MGSRLESGTATQLEEFVSDWLVDANVPGASFAVVKDDEVAYTGGFGSSNLNRNEPATPNTLYGIASCTKSFTALSILLLEERGALSVDDPVTTHLDMVDLEGTEGPITLHDLLTHSSGLPSLGVSSVLLYRRSGIKEYSIPLGDHEDFYRHLNGAQDEIGDSSGERFMYFNSGYNLLGAVVEEASGQSFDEFIECEILAPLGMTQSTFDPTEVADEDLMTPYVLEDGEPEAVPFTHQPVCYGAGGLIAPVTELTRYIRLQANGGTFDGVDLLSAEALKRAHAGYIERVDTEYGYGWNRSEFLGRAIIGHGGTLGFSSAYIGFTEDGKYAIAIGANTTPSPNPATVAKGVLALLEGEDPYRVVPYFARTKKFDELTGEYESYRGITKATVEQHGGVLQLTSKHALEEQTDILLPTDQKQPGYEFEVPTMNGTRKTAEFEIHDDHIDLYYGRHRLHKES